MADDKDDYDAPTQAFDFAAANKYVPPDYNAPDYPRYDESQHDPVHWMRHPMDASRQETTATSGLDALFGDSRFEADGRFEGTGQFQGAGRFDGGAGPTGYGDEPPAPHRRPLSGGVKALLWITGSLLAILALMGLFVVGTQLAPVLSPDPVITPTPTPSSTFDPYAEVLGPVVPGQYRWDELLGTECVDPYTNAWQQDFTVVDCAAPHQAQLVFRGLFTDSATVPYPGVTALQARMNILCTSAKNINYKAAQKFKDIQFSASFAADEVEWNNGSRAFFCFVNRSGGEPLTASVAKPDLPTPWLTVVPAPEP